MLFEKQLESSSESRGFVDVVVVVDIDVVVELMVVAEDVRGGEIRPMCISSAAI